MLDDHLKTLLPEAIEFAQAVGAGSIVCFSFSRGGMPGGNAPAGVVETLGMAAERCAEAGLDLLVETEEGHWADIGERSAAIVNRVGHPALGINWDPANALIDGDVPFPAGYGFVKRFVRNVHFKDARRYPDGTWKLLPEGDVDWKGRSRRCLRTAMTAPSRSSRIFLPRSPRPATP